MAHQVTLVTLAEDAPSAQEIAALAMAGGAFDWLSDEPRLSLEEAG